VAFEFAEFTLVDGDLFAVLQFYLAGDDVAVFVEDV